ncbi:hypothetical protein L596_011220 [Steinernema carpocapsae]|uniref:Uncharacterized protein n=1 Tax=Steinernema carpocapsae TaxID=34508 RepID=A0A4U5NT42_STECR|nr:hypothetical protein L596_011220 [Steinernema carpocapsae]
MGNECRADPVINSRLDRFETVWNEALKETFSSQRRSPAVHCQATVGSSLLAMTTIHRRPPQVRLAKKPAIFPSPEWTLTDETLSEIAKFRAAVFAKDFDRVKAILNSLTSSFTNQNFAAVVSFGKPQPFAYSAHTFTHS